MPQNPNKITQFWQVNNSIFCPKCVPAFSQSDDNSIILYEIAPEHLMFPANETREPSRRRAHE
jgi:hypothetical protein